ncbi:hypothetical protein ACKAV7_011934 [Fusarium commune]
MDIQGAFDTVMRNRLVLHLREQGWPEHLVRWAESFMSGRLAQPIYRLGNPQGRFGYADDTAILSIGDTVDETTAMASGAIDEMVRWGATNGVSFDSKKTEVMHFSRSKLRAAPAVHHGDIEKHPESALRWLGIWLDSRLSFRIHVEKWAAKAQAVAYHLRGLTNMKHGPLPATKTTPIAALHRESGIPPVAQLLEARRLRFSARLKSLDEAHPLASRTRPHSQPAYHDLIKRRYQAQTESSFRTRLRRTDELLAPCARPKLVQRRFHQELLPPLQMASKDKSAEAFLQWLETVDLTTWIEYSDGSLSSEGAASYGFAIHQKDLSICDGSGRLGSAEVFDAEATGALEGLRAALTLQDSATQDIIVCLDNLAAATCLRGTPSDSSQDVFLEFQALAASHGAT